MTTLRTRLLGLLMIAVMIGGTVLSLAFYNKWFSTYTTVTLHTDKVGNQLDRQSDVKVRGLIVGEVSQIESSTSGATMTLRLYPEMAKMIPANVSARLLPKTLFGERFVSLEVPPGDAAAPLRDGDSIPQDRTSNATELESTFEHLMPVLQAVQPQKLNSTLTAVSTALRGRGKPIGDTLTELGQYLGELNPQVPNLTKNLQELAKFSNTLGDAAPDLADALDNLRTPARTVAQQAPQLRDVYASITQASVDTQSFLQANSDNIISLADVSRPTAELLARYSPEYPCVISQMAQTVPKIDQALGKGTGKPGLRATIEIGPNRGPYRPGEEPKFEDKRGPRCYDMKQFPMPFPQHPPDGPIKDGSNPPPPARSSGDGLMPPANAMQGGGSGAAAATPVNSPQEAGVLSYLVGRQTQTPPEQVPGWSGMLVGPLYRGAAVSVR